MWKVEENQIKDIKVDEQGMYRIKGRTESDHNTILVTINTDIKPRKETTKRWKLKNKEGWKEYNNQFIKEVQLKKPESQEELQDIMVKTLKKTVGQITITKGEKKKQESMEIKTLRKQKREAAKNYREEIKVTKNRENNMINVLREKYYQTQKALRKEIEEEEKRNIRKQVEKLTEEGNTKSNRFWFIKKDDERENKETYNLITEEGEEITDPEQVKEYTAKYYENLLQARDSSPEYEKWTKDIERKLKEIEKK